MYPRTVSSWGNVARPQHCVVRLASRGDPFPDRACLGSVLPFGNGRSYGDSCLNADAGLIEMRGLDRFIEFDAQSGKLICESGVLLADVLKLTVPKGWFVPVTPGTRFVTIGGAIANDVHGKNHHHAGAFCRHVRRFELLRSDGSRLICSDDQNSEWRDATVGGLGLTGVITWAEIALRRIANVWMDVESIRFNNVDEFFALCAESDDDYEYTVAWVDCLGRGRNLGRGLLQRANHATADVTGKKRSTRRLSIPCTPPVSLVNNVSLRLFNTAYYHLHSSARHRQLQHYETFFYPLDAVAHWNRLYGPHGFYQYQCVVTENPRDAIAALLEAIARSGLGSFLAVLKLFGALPSRGMLSFPREGATLALDFPNRGERLERLFRELDAIVAGAGGCIYPAKDGRMPGALFRAGYPRWQQFSQFIDPRFSSSFWRRVMQTS